MTSPLLNRYGHPAELARGLKWVDEFESNEWVERNDGALTSAPVINHGADFDGTDDYITYDIAGDTFADAESISIIVEFDPDFATDVDDDNALLGTPAADYLINKATNAAANVLSIVLGGTTIADIAEATYSPAWVQNGKNVLVISGTSGNTSAWLNGVQILTNDATAWTPATQTSLVVGAASGGSNFFDGSIYSVRIFNVALTEQEALDYCSGDVWNYREDTKFYLPMRAEQHDPVNVRTLDASGNGNHFQFGDGSTAATFPAKLTRRGYQGDGVDTHLRNTSIGNIYNSDVSIECVAELFNETTNGLWCIRDGFQDGIQFAYEGGGGTLAARYNTVTASAAFPIIRGVKRHLLVTFDVSGNMTLYINGEIAASADISAQTINLTSTTLFLMSLGSGTANTAELSGEMYQAAIYTRVLTPTQVLDCYLDMMGRLQHV